MSSESLRNVGRKAVAVVLRVPGLFIAEAWYRTDPLTIQHQYTSLTKDNVEQPHEIVFYLLHYTALLLSFMLIILPLKKLVQFYLYVLSGLLMLSAHFLSAQYVKTEKAQTDQVSVFESEDRMRTLGMFLVAQGVISAFVAYLVNLHSGQKMCLFMLHTAPMLARVITASIDIIQKIHSVSTLAAILIAVYFTFNNIPVVMDLVKDAVRQLMVAVQLYGWIPVLMALWFKILLPMQFLTFWCVLFSLQLYKYLSIANHPIIAEGWIVVLLASIGECCVTPLSLLGLSITVSYVSHIILTVTKLILQGRDAFLHTNVMHQGWTEGFTMFLLGIQTGIIELKAAQRAFLMSIVLFIVLSSLIQSMFEITDPILLALGASQNKNVLKHVRAVAMCTLLWVAPLYMTVIICQLFDLDFWLMVVISSCVLTSVQVVGSLIVYALFIYDAIKHDPWTNLDDVVYYAKATTRVLEFIVALCVVFYGVGESLFGEWSFVNSSILFIHCYFNVWQRLQAGWKTYLARREAAKRIQSLPDATSKQLEDHDDVCAICYQDLTSAKITPCKHFFHATCLRKWLYVQDKCPLCHKELGVHTDEGSEHDGRENPPQAGGEPDLRPNAGQQTRAHSEQQTQTDRDRQTQTDRDRQTQDHSMHMDRQPQTPSIIPQQPVHPSPHSGVMTSVDTSGKCSRDVSSRLCEANGSDLEPENLHHAQCCPKDKAVVDQGNAGGHMLHSSDSHASNSSDHQQQPVSNSFESSCNMNCKTSDSRHHQVRTVAMETHGRNISSHDTYTCHRDDPRR